jgi:O-antigen/teichoic acid export membrane protein
MLRVLTWRFAYQLIGALAALVFGTLTARWLGPHDKGLVSLIALIAFMVSLIGALGVNEAVAYLRNRRGFTAAEVHAGLAVLIAGWGGVLAAGTAVVLRLWGPRLWHVDFPLWLAAATGALVLLRLWFTLGKSQLLAEGRYGVVNLLDVGFVLVPLLLLVPLTVWQGRTVFAVTASTVLAVLLVTVPLIPLTLGYRGAVRPARLRALAAETLRYSLQTFARVVGATLVYRVNVFIVGAMLSLRDVGWYTVALMFSETLLKIPDAVTWLLAPRVARAAPGTVNAMTARYLRWTLLGSAVLALGMAALTPWLVPRLLTPAFAPAVRPALLLLPGVLCACVYQLLSASLTGQGRARAALAPTWIGVAAMVALNLYAIPRWGLDGAAATASLAYALTAGLQTWQYCRATGAGAGELFLPQPADRAVLRAMRSHV